MVNKKFLILIGVICVVIIAVFTSLLIVDNIKYGSYVAVKAEIIKVESFFGDSSKTNMQQSHYVTYSYKYYNKEQTAQKQVFFKSRYKVGDIVDIRINPDNINEVENTMRTGAYIVVDIFVTVFLGLLCILIFRKSNV